MTGKAKLNDIHEVFPNYVELFNQLTREYELTPEWRMIRKFRLLNKMGKVNKAYDKWFNKLIEEKTQK